MLKLKRGFLSNMEKVNRCGMMELSTMEIGEMVWLRGKEPFTMPTVMCTPENSIKIELMDLECMFTQMARDMKDSGKMTIKTDLEKKSLKMDPSMTVCSRMERNGDKELTNGLMKVFISEIGLITTSREKENTGGQTAECTRVNGKKINFMEEEYILGQMVECTMVTMKMIRNMDKVHTHGLMENPMKDNGLMANNMEKLDLQIQKEEARWASGKMERELNG